MKTDWKWDGMTATAAGNTASVHGGAQSTSWATVAPQPFFGQLVQPLHRTVECTLPWTSFCFYPLCISFVITTAPDSSRSYASSDSSRFQPIFKKSELYTSFCPDLIMDVAEEWDISFFFSSLLRAALMQFWSADRCGKHLLLQSLFQTQRWLNLTSTPFIALHLRSININIFTWVLCLHYSLSQVGTINTYNHCRVIWPES